MPDPNSTYELREQYHVLVDVGELDRLLFTIDRELFHDVVDQHINKLELVFADKAELTASDEFIGRLLFASLLDLLAANRLRSAAGYILPNI